MIYLKDGNIPLNLAYDDDIVQEANSTYQLSFKFPLTDGKWNLLKREVFLLADDLHGEQEFFIFEVKKVNSHVQVYAKQVATLLNYYSINSISVDRVPGQTVMTALAGSVKRPCPFTFFSDILDRHTFNESNVSVMDALAKDKHSVIGQWGGDLVRDKYQVKLLKNGGTENESLFMYKKNLSSYEESENINNLKTRLHLKKIIQGQSEGEEDRVIVVTVDSPLISQYSQIYEADIEVNDQDVTDEASLLAYGQRYFGSTLCDLVENSINLDVKGKSDVSVKMFDTVSVFHERFDVDLRLKITSYHFGPMSKRLKSIGFGKVSQSFGSTVASMVAGSIDKATGRLSASFEQKLQKEIDNANRHFDAEFEKRVEEINDGIEQAQAEAERYADAIKQEIDTEIAQVNQSMQAQSEEHDRQVADILAKTQSVESLANQAKTDAASAIAQALQFENEAIAEATRLDTVERQATETKLATAKSQVISEATRLVETAKSLLSGQIANVSTDLSQTKEAIKLLATKATVDTLTGRVSSAEAMIQVQADQISQRVKTSDFDQAKQRISTAESSITQLGNRITTEISETVAKIPKELGIRNLIKGTKDLSGNNPNQNTSDTYLGFNIARSRPSSGYVDTFRVATTINATATAYVTTFYARSDVDGFLIDCHLFSPNTTTSAESSTGHKTKAIDGLVNVRLTTEWKRYWVKWTQTPVNEIKNLIVGRNRVERGNATVEIAGVALYEGDMPKDWSPAPEDAVTEIENVKTIITQTAEGQQQLSTRLIEAQGKITTAETNIRQLISDVSSKVSQTDYNTLTGRVDSAETAITQNATEISKRLTKTQVDKAITDKGYQTKSDVDSNITGRGYITSSALQPYALAATVQTLVRETADSFSRTISETRALIPTSAGGRNYLLNSKTEISGAWSNKAISLSQELLDNLSKIKTVTISCDVEGANVSAINSRKRYGLACSVEINGVVNYWEVWQTQDTTKKRISQTFSVPEGKTITKFYSPSLWIQADGNIKVSNPKLEFGVLPTDWSPAPEDYVTVTAFNTVTDTVNSHTRTLSEQGSSISQAVQTAQGLITRVENLSVGGRNYFLKSDFSISSGNKAIAIHPDFMKHAKGKKFVVSVEVEGKNVVFADRGRFGISTSGQRPGLTWRDWLEVWETGTGNIPKKRIYQVFSYIDDWVDFGANLYVQTGGEAIVGYPKLEIGTMPTDWSPAPEDGDQAIEAKASKTDVNNLTGRMTNAETTIQTQAGLIEQRLTSTQVEQAITGKGYQTKSDVDSNITGRGYITSSALQPYALSTTVQNLVKETSDSFSRTISETRALIPTSAGGRNYLLNSKTEISGGWVSKVISLSQELLDNLNKIKTVTISCDVEDINVSTKNSRKRYGLACSVEINGIVNYWEVWQTEDTIKKRISQTFTVPEGKTITKFYSPTLWIQAEGSVKVSNPKLEFGVLSTDWTPAPEDLATVTALHAVNDTVDSHTRTIGAVGEAGSILDNVSKVTQTAQGLVQEVSGTNGLKTQVSTLAGSYAIKNLTKAGDVLGQINLNSDGSVRINEGLISVGTKTYIQDGVITSAKIAGLDAGKITSGYLASGRIKAGSIDGSKIAFDEAFFNGLVANQAYLKKLFAKDAFLTAVQAVAVSAKQITGGIAEALNGGMDVNFDESKINFYTNVAAIRRIYTGHPTQFIKFETEGNYSRTIIGSNRNGGEVFNSATFAGIVVENTNNINTEDNVRIYGDNTLLRHAQGDVGWNINSVTQRIVPANMNAESEIWSKHFVAPDKNSKPVRLDTAVAALWDIWNHIIYNNFEFNAALRTHIKARRDNWKFELNL